MNCDIFSWISGNETRLSVVVHNLHKLRLVDQLADCFRTASRTDPTNTWRPTTGQRLPEFDLAQLSSALSANAPKVHGVTAFKARVEMLIAHTQCVRNERNSQMCYATDRPSGLRCCKSHSRRFDRSSGGVVDILLGSICSGRIMLSCYIMNRVERMVNRLNNFWVR